MQLARVILRVRSPETLARFYVDKLGMTVRDTQGEAVVVGYSGDDASIQLCRATSPTLPYEHSKTDCYWKIGITLPNVDYAHRKLTQDTDTNSLCDTQPHQLGEIGYMCHLKDPEGFTIELLQHKFESNREQNEGNEDVPFSEARIGQITLRYAFIVFIVNTHLCI